MPLCPTVLLMCLSLTWPSIWSQDDNVTIYNRDLTSDTVWTKKRVTEEVLRLTEEAAALATKAAELTSQLESVYGASLKKSGTVYVRWGSMSCPAHNVMVYSGVVGGGHNDHPGAPASPLCLPRDPVYEGNSRATYNGLLYGAEYQTEPNPPVGQDVVCAVCVTPHEMTLMVPARNTCHKGWRLEYSGYLMAGYYAHTAASEYVCMDSGMEGDYRSADSHGGKLFYHVVGQCGSLPCPPYKQNQVIVCAVCSM